MVKGRSSLAGHRPLGRTPYRDSSSPITMGSAHAVAFGGRLRALGNASAAHSPSGNHLFLGKTWSNSGRDSALVVWYGYHAHTVVDITLVSPNVAGRSKKTSWIPAISVQLGPLPQRFRPLRHDRAEASRGPTVRLEPFKNPVDTVADTGYFCIDLGHFTERDGEFARIAWTDSLIDTFAMPLSGRYGANRAYVYGYWPGRADGASRL